MAETKEIEAEVVEATEQSFPLLNSGAAVPAVPEHPLSPREQAMMLEEMAQYAPRIIAAKRTILMAYTHPQDWTNHEGNVCLGSAGAERLFDAVPGLRAIPTGSMRREEWSDNQGRAYRYVLEGFVEYRGSTFPIRATFGTRASMYLRKGKATGERYYLAIEDINEGYIQNAVYHIFRGEAVKAALGIRNLPEEQWQELITRTGQKATPGGKVDYNKGKKKTAKDENGNGKGEPEKQKELAQICFALAEANQMAVLHTDNSLVLEEADDLFKGKTKELARINCQVIGSFYGDNEEEVRGTSDPTQYTGKRLNVTLAKARKLKEEFEKGGTSNE